MFNADFFRKILPAQATAAGAESTVELHLMGGQGHRVRSIESVESGYVVLAVYQRHAENSPSRTRWQGDQSQTPEDDSAELQRAVVSYESITQIVITPPPADSPIRIGFGSR